MNTEYFVHPHRNPRDVPGPFYTTNNCLACDAPQAYAPTLLSPLRENNFETFFIKQPETEDEIEQACEAILVCCVGDLRYGGKDRSIISRLGNSSRISDYIISEEGEVTLAETHDA